MHDFIVKKNRLFCESCAVSDIAREVGTPAYIYSTHTILDHFEKLRVAFAGHPTTICYSVKSNSNINIISLLAKEGAGADIVSGGELFRALKAGIPPNKIVFSGVGKTDEEIRYAIDTGIRFFNVESVPELSRISEIAVAQNQEAGISIRVNPDIDAGTHHFTTTGKKENKFGLPISQVVDNYKTASALPNLRIEGIDVHLGSPLLSLEPYLHALKLLADSLQQLEKEGLKLTTLDLGGGLGIVYDKEDAFTAKSFAETVMPRIKETGLDLIIEPGRFIVGNAGILVSKVIYVKKTTEKTFIIVDAGMNDLIRPPLYNGYHKIVPLDCVEGEKIVADVVGPICESSDFFAKDREISVVKEGDYIGIMSAGAYGFSMSSNYNSRPRPCEVLVKADQHRIIRRRESYEDLIKGE